MVSEVRCANCATVVQVDGPPLSSAISCPTCGQVIGSDTVDETGSATMNELPVDPIQPQAALPDVENAASSMPWEEGTSATTYSENPFASASEAVVAPRMAHSETVAVESEKAGDSFPESDSPADVDAAPAPSFAESGSHDVSGGFADLFGGQVNSTAPATIGLERGQPSSEKAAKPAPVWLTYAIVYVCGAMLGLVVGRFLFSKPSAAPSQGLEVIPDYGLNKEKTKWISPNGAVPRGQRKDIGKTVRLEGLEVTALGVERRSISLVRINPLDRQREETTADGCLVLRVRLKNTSKDVEFAPLDEMFLRPHDPKRYPTYSYIERLDDRANPIPMFELAPLSERNIEGQSFDALAPGEEAEAIIAAASGSADQAKGRMLWRLQLRTAGPKGISYSTVVGFDFSADQIEG